jgi:hypothetical protein
MYRLLSVANPITDLLRAVKRQLFRAEVAASLIFNLVLKHLWERSSLSINKPREGTFNSASRNFQLNRPYPIQN